MTSQADGQVAVAAAAPSAAVPRHVAIIMDGNGRWAAERGLPRSEGHRRGVEAVRRTADAAIEAGIEYLTLFSFSSENWSRPRTEVDFLFGLVRAFIRRDLARLHARDVRIIVIGARTGLPRDIAALIDEAEQLTVANRGLRLVIAFNYGARDEITRAVRVIAEKVKAGILEPGAIDEALIARHLDTATIPDPDLIVRTSGEVRLSNFLLWQAAYAEMVFLPIYWPDFGSTALRTAIDQYATRVRRYGGLAARNSA